MLPEINFIVIYGKKKGCLEMKRKWRIIALLLCLTVSLNALQPVSAAKKRYIKLNSSTKIFVLKGKTEKIKAKTIGGKKKITYRCSNKNIASVSSKGVIRGKKYGKTIIYLKAKGLKTKKISVYIKNPITGLKLSSPSNVTFSSVGKTSQIKASVNPSKRIMTKRLSYVSSNKKVAAVSKSGRITAKGPGKAVITVSTSREAGRVYQKKIQVYVNIPVTSIVAKDMQLSEWQSKDIKAAVLPSNATVKTLSYSSSNSKIASVSSQGVVTGLNEGKVQITIKAMDNKIRPKTKRIIVNVIKGSYQWPEGADRQYENGKTCFKLHPEKLKKVEVLFRSRTGKIYAYTIKDVEADFKKLERAGVGTKEEKNGVKVSKINSNTFRFELTEIRESYDVNIAYSQYRLYIKGDFTNGEKIKLNKVN